MNLQNGNCLELMKTLPDKSIDLFICDLPYGETNCKWDSKIDMDEFWSEFKRLRKSKRTACIHFCSTKFGYTLIKSWEKGFKMDMVWKKRNKTGGLQSRHRPMRNHEMVYFFYEQAPKYNRDKYHKRIVAIKPNVKEVSVSVVEDMDEFGWSIGKLPKGNRGKEGFKPVLPVSVVEEKVGGDIYGEDKKDQLNRRKKIYEKTGNVNSFEPPNPASVVEEKDERINEKNKSSVGWDIKYMDKPRVPSFEPKLPASVVEEKYTKDYLDNKQKTIGTGGSEMRGIFTKENIKQYNKENGVGFLPPNPASVLDEDEPKSMFESTKVFIGKRHHQTEKPQDILEFFLKYWTDENDTVLDPTMGSGSTGVACKKLNRKFIGFELDEKIFEVAKNRCLDN